MRTPALTLVCLLFSIPALARNGGIQIDGCDGCHSGASGASVSIALSPAAPSPGERVTVTVTISGPGSGAGFFLTTRGDIGNFATIAGEGTQLLGLGVAHSGAKASTGGSTTFRAQWTAPAMPGGTDFQVAALSSNRNGGTSGDASAVGQLSLTWGCSGITYYRDFDNDGVGRAAAGTTKDCTKPAGYAAIDGDCDDYDPRIKPGGVEACNGRDDTCDGVIDEGLSSTLTFPDLDGDGYGAANGMGQIGCTSGSRAPTNDDCNDNNPKVHPNAPEVCNLVDDNCNAKLDDGIEAVCGVGACQRKSITCDIAFCTAAMPSTETCNGLDDDCDGEIDNGTLCAENRSCYRGKCVLNGTVPAVVDPPKTGCAAAPAALLPLGAAVFLLLRRRRRA